MTSIIKTAVVATILNFIVTAAFAGQTGCPEHFTSGSAPEIVNQKLAVKTREVCYSGYAIKHSGITRTPLYAAEHLTRERLIQGKGLKRQSQFHPDDSIPPSERAELHHYSRSGYDRGHVAPSADMFDIQSQHESFSLANMVPQVPENNRGPWEAIESTVRKLAKSRGSLYIVSGPLYKGENIQRVGGAVLVPTHMFKAIYDPDRHEAGAYLIENAENAQAQKISVSDLETLTGINLFPSVDRKIKNHGMTLPDPKSFRERKTKGK